MHGTEHLLIALGTNTFGQVAPVSPTSSGLPGSAGIHTILAWLMFGGLTVCGASAIIGATTLAYAHHTARPDLAVRAKSGFLWALGGAFVVGIAIPLVNAFYGLA